MTFGADDATVYFSTPVEVVMPIDGKDDGTLVSVLSWDHVTASWSSAGITDSVDAMCVNGQATPVQNVTVVEDGKIQFYVCRATNFIAQSDR